MPGDVPPVILTAVQGRSEPSSWRGSTRDQDGYETHRDAKSSFASAACLCEPDAAPSSPTGVASLAGSLLSGPPSTAPSTAPPTPLCLVAEREQELPPATTAMATAPWHAASPRAACSGSWSLTSRSSLASACEEEGGLPAAAEASGWASAADLAAANAEEPPAVDVELVVHRVRAGVLTGQVVAWAWAQAARLSSTRRAMPAELLTTLWPAALACVDRFTAQDLLEVMQSWRQLATNCPRHFAPSPRALTALAERAFPAAVKRMGEADLRTLGTLCADLALLRTDPLSCSAPPGAGGGGGAPARQSVRDLLRPAFSLVAAEVAWRLESPLRYVSRGTVEALLGASSAWRWHPMRRGDSPHLAVLMEGTWGSIELMRAAAYRTPEVGRLV